VLLTTRAVRVGHGWDTEPGRMWPP
jgi:hypothetical protein